VGREWGEWGVSKVSGQRASVLINTHVDEPQHRFMLKVHNTHAALTVSYLLQGSGGMSMGGDLAVSSASSEPSVLSMWTFL